MQNKAVKLTNEKLINILDFVDGIPKGQFPDEKSLKVNSFANDLKFLK